VEVCPSTECILLMGCCGVGESLCRIGNGVMCLFNAMCVREFVELNVQCNKGLVTLTV